MRSTTQAGWRACDALSHLSPPPSLPPPNVMTYKKAKKDIEHKIDQHENAMKKIILEEQTKLKGKTQNKKKKTNK